MCNEAYRLLAFYNINDTIAVKETDTGIILQNKRFRYTLDKRTGLFRDIRFAGEGYLNHPMELNIWRVPTDNDMYVKQEWIKP